MERFTPAKDFTAYPSGTRVQFRADVPSRAPKAFVQFLRDHKPELLKQDPKKSEPDAD